MLIYSDTVKIYLFIKSVTDDSYVYHIFVRYPYCFACVINEDVPDPYQCPGQITGYCALRR